jgi:hypothetical protein
MITCVAYLSYNFDFQCLPGGSRTITGRACSSDKDIEKINRKVRKVFRKGPKDHYPCVYPLHTLRLNDFAYFAVK